MESVKEIAIGYYDTATREEKKLVDKYSNKIGFKPGGKINFEQYKGGVAKHLSDEKIYKKLDANRKGSWDFDDIKCLYYMEKKLGLDKCASCRDLLVGAYFSCLRCVEDRFDPVCRLCCRCYNSRDNFTHVHNLSDFLDQHTMMAKLMKKRTSDVQQDRRKTELEELRQIAISYYKAGSKEVQKLAHEFFESMDKDGNGKIDASEFLDFMKEAGHTRMQDSKFFEELDADGKGTLDFDKVMTAYYIIKSGRPFCNKCRNFIRGTFFSCVECYSNPKDSFNLCCDCYRSRKCDDHKHDGRAHFLDNFVLLQAMKSAIQAPKSDQQNDQATSLAPSNSQATTAGKTTSLVPLNSQATTAAKTTSVVPSNSKANTAAKTTSVVPSNSQATTGAQKNSSVPSHNVVTYNNYVTNNPPAVIIHTLPGNQRRSSALEELEKAIGFGNFAITVASFVVGCTIM